MTRCDPNRIFKRVVQDAATGCWNYHGGRSSSGYGIVSVCNKSVGAHRLSFELANGPIPKGLWVLHRCDNPSCINPDHLFLGTAADNNADCKSKRRTACRIGEKNTRARLVEKTVMEIRRLANTGISQRKIARQFGISQQHVSAISRGRFWSHLQEAS